MPKLKERRQDADRGAAAMGRREPTEATETEVTMDARGECHAAEELSAAAGCAANLCAVRLIPALAAACAARAMLMAESGSCRILAHTEISCCSARVRRRRACRQGRDDHDPSRQRMRAISDHTAQRTHVQDSTRAAQPRADRPKGESRIANRFLLALSIARPPPRSCAVCAVAARSSIAQVLEANSGRGRTQRRRPPESRAEQSRGGGRSARRLRHATAHRSTGGRPKPPARWRNSGGCCNARRLTNSHRRSTASRQQRARTTAGQSGASRIAPPLIHCVCLRHVLRLAASLSTRLASAAASLPTH